MDVERAKETIAAETPPRLRIEQLLHELGGRDVTVGELVDQAGEAGFGFLVGILTLVAIPFFGLSTPFGLAIALVGAQLALGRKRPWLPRRARARTLTEHMLGKVAAMLDRRARKIAKLARPRWERAIMPRLVGLGIVVLALGLALPLPVPGSNMIFLVPLFVYAVGLLERDGAWIAIGHVATLVDVALLVVFGDVVVRVLARLWHWLF